MFKIILVLVPVLRDAAFLLSRNYVKTVSQFDCLLELSQLLYVKPFVNIKHSKSINSSCCINLKNNIFCFFIAPSLFWKFLFFFFFFFLFISSYLCLCFPLKIDLVFSFNVSLSHSSLTLFISHTPFCWQTTKTITSKSVWYFITI